MKRTFLVEDYWKNAVHWRNMNESTTTLIHTVWCELLKQKGELRFNTILVPLHPHHFLYLHLLTSSSHHHIFKPHSSLIICTSISRSSVHKHDHSKSQTFVQQLSIVPNFLGIATAGITTSFLSLGTTNIHSEYLSRYSALHNPTCLLFGQSSTH